MLTHLVWTLGKMLHSIFSSTPTETAMPAPIKIERGNEEGSGNELLDWGRRYADTAPIFSNDEFTAFNRQMRLNQFRNWTPELHKIVTRIQLEEHISGPSPNSADNNNKLMEWWKRHAHNAPMSYNNELAAFNRHRRLIQSGRVPFYDPFSGLIRNGYLISSTSADGKKNSTTAHDQPSNDQDGKPLSSFMDSQDADHLTSTAAVKKETSTAEPSNVEPLLSKEVSSTSMEHFSFMDPFSGV